MCEQNSQSFYTAALAVQCLALLVRSGPSAWCGDTSQGSVHLNLGPLARSHSPSSICEQPCPYADSHLAREGVQGMLLQNVPLWHKYSALKATRRKQTQKELSVLPLFTCQQHINPFVKVFPSSPPPSSPGMEPSYPQR